MHNNKITVYTNMLTHVIMVYTLTIGGFMTPAEIGEKAAREENQLRHETAVFLKGLNAFIVDASDNCCLEGFVGTNEEFIVACTITYVSLKKGRKNES